MFAVSPVIELANIPVPVPSVVWLPVTTGFTAVLQQTPRAVTVAPPSDVILPPLNAVVLVMDVTAVVVIVGTSNAGPFSGLSSFWQLKEITDKNRIKNKFFI